MSRDEYIHTVNPCYDCGSYDSDLGCTMSSVDTLYACPQNTEEFKIKDLYYNDKDFKGYVDRYSASRKISPAEALDHVIVINYAKYLEEPRE